MLFIVPFLGWFISGSIKFLINYLNHGSKAKELVGNGGFPSTHTTIVISTTTALGFKNGFDSDLFAIGICLSLIIVMDAMGIRKALGSHAKNINSINNTLSISDMKHREKQGHTSFEILGGVLVGGIIGYIFHIVNGLFL